MKLTWLDRDDPDPRLLAGAVAVGEAARALDFAEFPSETVRSYLANFRHGWDGEPADLAVHTDDRGRVTATLHVWLPRRDNTHLAHVHPTVDVARRREGLGRRLVEAGIDYARQHDRTVVTSDSVDRDGYARFAAALGFDLAAVEVIRRQDLVSLDWKRLSDLHAEAQAHATDYELVPIVSPTPADLLGDIAVLTAAINDAPRDDLAWEDEVFTAERIQAFDKAQAGRDRRVYRLVARHRESGELAGQTVVAASIDRPWAADQYDTSVLKHHRGHRLGLLLKIEMLRWLADAEPQLRTLITDNAESNAHMIAVNELLGYELVKRVVEWQLKLEDS